MLAAFPDGCSRHVTVAEAEALRRQRPDVVFFRDVWTPGVIGAKSKARPAPSSPPRRANIVAALSADDIANVIRDLRLSTLDHVARKYGFSKSTAQKIARRAGVRKRGQAAVSHATAN